MDELKPCPFCGGDPKITHAVLKEYYSVDPDIACEECGYHIKEKNLAINMDDSPKENCDFLDRQTIKVWNTRPAEDALKAELEELAGYVKRFRETLAEVAKMAIYAEQEQIFEKCRDALRDVYLEEKFRDKFDKILHAPDTEKGGEDE